MMLSEAVDEQTFAITIILVQFHFTQANCRVVMGLHYSSKNCGTSEYSGQNIICTT